MSEDEFTKAIEDKLAGEDFLVGGIHAVLCIDKNNGKQYLTVAATGELTKFQSLGMLEVAKSRLMDLETS